MKRKLLIVLVCLTASFSWGQGLKADGTKIVNASGEEVILRGVGPGGWQIMEGYMMQTSGVAGSQHEIKEKLIDLMGEEKTETFFEKWRENHFTKQDVDSLAAWGFNSIRIPMHYNLFTLPIEDEPISGENTWIETGFELIDNVLEWSAPHDIYVILDMHATPGGQGTGSEINDYDPSKPSLWESQENKDKLVALWTRIAERYKDNPWIGGYDLINETHWNIPGGTALKNLYVDITNGIRSVDQEHMLFIEGNWYANDYTGLTPPWDDNMVYSFHKYWSYNNANDLDWILWMRDQFNVPLWMGESGENSNTWFTDAVKLFEDNGIGWAWWTMRKIGDIDSPYAVDINPGYQDILDYWNGRGSKPTEQEAFDGMMQLAENLLVENSRYRKDVPDALIRQPHTDETIPFNGAPTTIPGVLFMSDFDLGKNNFAYSDDDVADYHINTGEFQAWNRGWSYRNDGVDIETNEDVVNSNGFNVAHAAKGEWIKYTVAIEKTAAYKAKLRVATQSSGGEFYMSLDDQEITPSTKVNSTGGWTQFQTMEVENIIMEAGTHALKFHFNSGTAFNISSIEFIETGTVDDVAFNALNGKTGADEKSIELTLSESYDASTIENTKEDFTVFVNGIETPITSVVANQESSKDRALTLNLVDFITSNTIISVSYSGNAIKSETGKTLGAFTKLPIVNEAVKRVVIPAKIEVEDYDYMQGLVEEESQDVGGGINFGYTDPGDYADYAILVPINGNYRVYCRVAGYDAGKIGFFTVSEDGVETAVGEIVTIQTGGWQTWESVSGNVALSAGTHTLRMKIIEGGFNFNWFEFGYPDTDGDGVFDDKDNCPDTPIGSKVDIYGCPIFSMPTSNYIIKISSETCRSSNNGRLDIAVEDSSYTYTVNLSGASKNENTFNSESSFENLTAGAYEVCFTIAEVPEYQQCFDVLISEPSELKVSANKEQQSSKVTVELSGADMYFVTLNDETIITKESEIELELNSGVNKLHVTSNKACQGEFSKTFELFNTPVVYPNPVIDNQIFVNGGNYTSSIESIEIYSITGQLIQIVDVKMMLDVLRVDVSSLPKGVFIVKITTKEDSFNFKMLK